MSFINYSLYTWGTKNVYNLQKIQKSLIEKYKVMGILLLNELYIYKKIKLVRQNKLDKSYLNYKEMQLYFQCATMSNDCFKQHFYENYSWQTPEPDNLSTDCQYLPIKAV